MPTNIGDAPLDDLKIGQAAVSKGYVGINQIFPNTTEITAAAFDNANVTNAAQNTDYTVAGEIGSSFTLTGSSGATGPAGTQILSSSPTTYPIAIGDNTTCQAPARNPSIVIAPIGSTVLASGLSNTDALVQASGPSQAMWAISGTTSVTYTGGASGTSQIGGTWYWVAGATWDVSYAVTGNIPYSALDPNGPALYGYSQTPSTFGNYSVTNTTGPSGVTGVNGPLGNLSYKNCYWTWTGTVPNGTYSYTLELVSGQHSYMKFGLVANLPSGACATINGGTGGYISSPNIYTSLPPNG